MTRRFHGKDGAGPRWPSLCLLALVAVSGSALAAPPERQRATGAAEAEVPAGAHRKGENAALPPGGTPHKVRQDSVLWRKKPPLRQVDLRSDAERQRDGELEKYSRRMAQLAVISELAQSLRDPELAAHAEDVVLKEVRRFLTVMQRRRSQSRLAAPYDAGAGAGGGAAAESRSAQARERSP